jgi:AcrR family transcriptional regulator
MSKKKQLHLPVEVRRSQIIGAALRLADDLGVGNLRRDQIAALAGCSAGLVSKHYSTMAQLRRAVMGEAIATRCLSVVAQGLVLGDPRAKAAPEELRRAAAAHLLGE